MTKRIAGLAATILCLGVAVQAQTPSPHQALINELRVPYQTYLKCLPTLLETIDQKTPQTFSIGGQNIDRKAIDSIHAEIAQVMVYIYKNKNTMVTSQQRKEFKNRELKTGVPSWISEARVVGDETSRVLELLMEKRVKGLVFHAKQTSQDDWMLTASKPHDIATSSEFFGLRQIPASTIEVPIKNFETTVSYDYGHQKWIVCSHNETKEDLAKLSGTNKTQYQRCMDMPVSDDMKKIDAPAYYDRVFAYRVEGMEPGDSVFSADDSVGQCNFSLLSPHPGFDKANYAWFATDQRKNSITFGQFAWAMSDVNVRDAVYAEIKQQENDQ
jgi:hypothetical protein